MASLRLETLPGRFAICRLAPDAELPAWARGSFVSSTRTLEELSIVCPDEAVPDGVRCESGRSALRVAGTLDMGLIGVLARLTRPLADAGVALFAVSTYDTDYLFVDERDLATALRALRAAGHTIDDPAAA